MSVKILSSVHKAFTKIQFNRANHNKLPKILKSLQVLNTIGKTQQSVQAVVNRARDRQKAYECINRITARSQTRKKLDSLVKDAPQDKSRSTFVRNVILPAILQYYGGKYLRFLRAIHTRNCNEFLKLLLIYVVLPTVTGHTPIYCLIPIGKIWEFLENSALSEIVKSYNLADESERAALKQTIIKHFEQVIPDLDTEETLQKNADEIEQTLEELEERLKNVITEFESKLNASEKSQ